MARDNRQLGRFKLEGIRPAPRGVPQIEVTFDIDANGILNVGAKDKETNKEQKITISGSTNLDKGEVDRMVNDADTHATEDRKRKEAIEEHNQADSLAYQVERMLQELGDKVPVHEKARCEQLIADIRQAVKEEAPVERIRQLKSDLQQASYALSSAVAQQAQAGAGQGAQPGPEANPKSDQRPASDEGEVIDAEFTEK